jgi:hypothetical protein
MKYRKACGMQRFGNKRKTDYLCSKEIKMRRIASYILVLILVIGVCCCNNRADNKSTDGVEKDSVEKDTLSTIEFMCRDAMHDTLTEEEAAHWDSMNANGGFLLIRGAERNLDTIVNHYHFVFTTEP